MLLQHTGTLRLRPSTSVPASRALPLLTSTHHHQLQARHASSSSTPPVPSEEPAQKAQSIIDALPGSSLISKTAILSTGAGVSIWAIANEIYVVNEETIVAFATLSVIAAIFRYAVSCPWILEGGRSHSALSRSLVSLRIYPNPFLSGESTNIDLWTFLRSGPDVHRVGAGPHRQSPEYPLHGQGEPHERREGPHR